MNESRGKRHSLTGGAGPYLMLGWQIALAFAVYAAIGYLVDSWLNTSPWLLLAGVLLGLVASMARIYRVSIESNRNPDRERGDKDVRSPVDRRKG